MLHNCKNGRRTCPPCLVIAFAASVGNIRPMLCCLAVCLVILVKRLQEHCFVHNFKSSSVMCPTLESCLFSVARAAKTDKKRPLRSTDAEGGGKVYICNTMLVTQASVIIKSANIIKILHP